VTGSLSLLLRTAALSAALCSTPALAEVESWYAYWGLGVCSNAYPARVEAAFALADTVPGATRDTVSLEFLGFYWPLEGTSTLVGGVIDISADFGLQTLAENDYAEIVAFDQRMYALSMMHFWGDEPGKGFFVRGDVGPAKYEFSSIYGPPDSGSGFGILIGAGYGIPMTEGARLLLNATYSSKLLEDETYSTAAINLAVLW